MSAATRSADSFYVEDCREAQHHTHAIQTLTGQISRLVGAMNTEEDFSKCRKLVDQAVSQASETRTILMRIHEHQQQAQNPAEKTNRRMMYHKLSDNLAITARVLEDVVRRFNAEVERKNLQLGPHATPVSSSSLGASDNPLLCSEVDTSRQVEPIRMDKDMKCLQQIYTDLAHVAEEQQASINTIEEHMASAAGDLEQGAQYLDMGKYDIEKRRKRNLMAVGAAGVAALCVCAFVAPVL